MSLFKKKPVVIEAFKWTGGPDQLEDPEWIVQAIEDGNAWFALSADNGCTMRVHTERGTMIAEPGDYVTLIADRIGVIPAGLFEHEYEPAGD